jgi:hypothetical protein
MGWGILLQRHFIKSKEWKETKLIHTYKDISPEDEAL